MADNKSKKHGRNSLVCAAYKNSNQREKNKLRRLRKHLVKFPNDNCAIDAVNHCKVVLGMR